MNQDSITCARSTNRFGRRLARTAVAVTALLGALATTASDASAYTHSASGYPGGINVPQAVGYGDGVTSYVTSPSRRVTESPQYAKYDQRVCAVYRLYRSSGRSWSLASSTTKCVWILGQATTAQLSGYLLTAAPQFLYSVDATITWQLSNGTVVGSRYIYFNQVGDYACASAKCSVGSTPTLGAYVLMAL